MRDNSNYTLEEFILTKMIVSKSLWQRGTGCFGICELEGDQRIQVLCLLSLRPARSVCRTYIGQSEGIGSLVLLLFSSV